MNHVYECSILIVDDNEELLAMIEDILRKKGFGHIYAAPDCKKARELAIKEMPDLAVLDVMLPDGDGFSLMRTLRAERDFPILFLSAKDEDNDRLLGLGLGADDYITKPFLPEELVLRVQAVLKRAYLYQAKKDEADETLVLGRHTVDFKSGIVIFENREIPLTAKELEILKKLNENRGNIVTFDALCQAVWQDNYYGYENTVMVHIRRLREKIEESPSNPRWLLTVRGLGYRLVKE